MPAAGGGEGDVVADYGAVDPDDCVAELFPGAAGFGRERPGPVEVGLNVSGVALDRPEAGGESPGVVLVGAASGEVGDGPRGELGIEEFEG